ncbi:CZB domain-containing protein [Sulfurimonas paralvinellae]|uniref:Chemoreceptor zinc-binding domain-containing protein n=1 Tax=Sulfurimonas paralvinellae TaxID=317658 RepID=A0A7M1B5X3_9BACT|nr:CZB domain-containing protein [Sulfurimonas paralvinellae]QOP45035.1 hypothetical protein FM071_01470 [Sulfurimonas paralvinellae]
MTKKEVLKAIEHAYEYHVDQMEKVTHLVNGEKVKNPTPRMPNECEFGRWLYGDASRIKGLLGIRFYKNMELIHEFWHIQYEKIYEIYYEHDQEKGLLTKILHHRHRLSKEEFEEAQHYYKDLKQATEDLLEVLTASKRRIIALKERMFLNID